MRSAISPRLAIRTVSNIAPPSTELEQRLARLDLLARLDQHGGDDAVAFRADLVERLHRFDHADDLPSRHALSGYDERRRARRLLQVDDAVQRRDDRARGRGLPLEGARRKGGLRGRAR